MAGHLRQHSFTGNTDHDFTGLQPNQLLKLNSSGTAIESFSTASTISLSSITNIDYIDFNTATTATVQTGRLIWNDSDEIGGLELGMKGGSVTLQVGEENLVRVYNDDTVTLTNGMVVYVYSSQGNTISVRRASNTGETTSARALGVVAESIPVGGRGYVNSYGLIRDLNTSAYSGGTPLYVGSTAGTFTDVRPTAPNHTCLIGFVSRVSPTVGSIFVHISNGWELGELHDVYFAYSALTTGDIIAWNDSNDRFEKTSIVGLGAVTGTGTSNYITKWNSTGSGLTNSLIYDNGTNLGVGTTSPNSKFHVMSTLNDGIKTESIQSGHYILASPGNNSFGPNITSSYALELKTPSAEIRLGRTGGTGNALIYVDSTITTGLNISGNAGGSPNLTLLSDGNVGAGTSTPLDKIHISNGTLRINDTGSTYGAGKLAVSDANGSISFSSTTALGLGSGTVGGTGTTNYIAKWSSTSALTDSLISEVGNTISINSSAVTINGGRLYSDGTTALNNAFWAASSSQPTIAGTRNLLLGNNDTGTFSVSGQFNNLIGSFNSIGLTSGQQNSIIGSYNSLVGLTTGSYNIGINSSFASNVSGSLAIGSSPDASNSVYIGSAGYYYPNWYLGLGKSATYLFGTTNMNWYASSVAEGDADKAATIPIWRFNGSRATGSGSSGDIRFAVSLSATTGTGWTAPTDVITVKGNSGFVGIGTSSPQEKLHISGNFRLNDVLSTYGSGKLAVSDANGTISFSSTTALGLITSAGTVNKYTTSTSLTAGVASYITHGLGLADATDAMVQIWSGNNLTLGAEVSAVTTNQIAVTTSVSGTYKIVVMG